MRTLLTFIISFLCVFILMIYTQIGLTVAVFALKRLMPSHFQLGHYEGRLRDHLLLQDLTYSEAGFQINIEKIELNWDFFALFHRQVVIHSLTANKLKINYFSNFNNKNNKKNNNKKNFIKNIILEAVEINHIEFYKDNIPKSIIDKITIRQPQFSIQLKKGSLVGSYVFEDINQWNWKVAATASNVDFKYLWPAFSSDISFEVFAEGLQNKHEPSTTIQLTHLTGSLFNYPTNGTINIHINSAQIDINSFDLTLGHAVMQAKGQLGKAANLQWNIDIPNMGEIYPNLKGSLKTAGSFLINNHKPFLQAIIAAKQIAFKQFYLNILTGKMHSDVLLQTVQFNLNADKVKLNTYLIPLLTLSGEAKKIGDGILTDMLLNISKNNSLTAHIQLPTLFVKKLTNPDLTGNIDLFFHDLNIITLPYAKKLQGKIIGKVNLKGTLQKPIYSGELQLQDGGFSIKELGISPHHIQLQFGFSEALLVRIKGQFKSGRGSGLLQGNINLNAANYPLQLTIKGDHLEAAHTKEYQITATPDLALTLNGENASILGKITLPWVHVVLENNYYDVVDLPSEVEFAHQKPKLRYFKNILIKTQLQLGEEAFVSYKNLRAHLAGEIFVYQLPGGLPSARGEIIIKEGTYQVYGRLFKIQQGRLIYVGNLLTNPGLNIRALQQASFPQNNFLGFRMSTSTDDMKIGVSITGTLDQPIIDFISEPPMSQEDILSYLVFGQSKSSISGLSALSLLGDLSASSQTPTTDDETEQSAGFFGIFKMGFFNPTQAFNLGLPLGRHWKIQTETSLNEIGADLLYQYNSGDEGLW